MDASVAVKWFLPEIHCDAARLLLNGDDELLAPELILPEVGNVLWKKWRTSELTATEVIAILQDFRRFPLQIIAMRAYLERAMRLAIDYERSVYDSIYLALAIQYQTVFITADRRLCNALNSTEVGSSIMWVENIEP